MFSTEELFLSVIWLGCKGDMRQRNAYTDLGFKGGGYIRYTQSGLHVGNPRFSPLAVPSNL
jgi:hypothetical protein